MTMMKLSGDITEIEGKVGGDVYRKDVCGQHIQAYPRLVKHESPSQIRQRKAFRSALYFCGGGNLTGEDVEKWWIYSKNHPKKNSKGETVYLTPFLACVRINTMRFRNDLEPITEPPE